MRPLKVQDVPETGTGEEQAANGGHRVRINDLTLALSNFRRVFGLWIRFVDHPRHTDRFGLGERGTKLLQFVTGQISLAAVFAIFLDATCRIYALWHEVPFGGE